jgi:N utilization substance protein B
MQSDTALDLGARDARSLIFHLIYAAEAFDYEVTLEQLIENFNKGFDIAIDAQSEIASIAAAVIEKRKELDEKIKPLLHNWRFDRIGVCTKLIIRLALWELDNTDISPNIIINEAIELAKCFAEKDAYKFVNGVLDEAIKNKIESVSDDKENSIT